ncbi:hypothetical protein DPMN_091514 [Dreissena polymorpha]|uniref:VWFA domain-containing protein n=1 Tax=Dreissena polymorpha TaxID=45954 RepID=A0A9D4R0S8_DREPO|nr:hypothetical protein DPMN_091514 [Dreissena polymorpha]
MEFLPTFTQHRPIHLLDDSHYPTLLSALTSCLSKRLQIFIIFVKSILIIQYNISVLRNFNEKAHFSTLGCVRDIVLIVEDYNEKNDHTHTGGYSTPYLVAFLKELVSSLTIGLSESLVELSLADSDVHSIWSLADHTTNDSLLTAINGIPFRHQKDNLDISGIVNYVSRDAFSIRSGDRPSVPNTVVIFVDHRARPSTSRTGQVNGVDYGAQHNVHLASGNVIIINIGPPDHSDVTKISVLATDASHVLTVADYAALSGIKETLVNLICN